MPLPPKQKYVLHINDNENAQYLVKRAIKSVQTSLMIRHVENAIDAVDFIDQAKLFNDLPCLIVMDIELTIDGQRAFEELRKDALLQAIPIVVFVSTSMDDTEIKKWSRSKIVFVPAPVKYRAFTKSIKKALSYCS